MTLHLLNKSQKNLQLIERMISTLSEGDSILLIEDGVYNALSFPNSWIDQHKTLIDIYVLQCDVDARGLNEALRNDIHHVDDKGFVELSCQSDKVVSWF